MTPTRPLNPDALGPMYEALKAFNLTADAIVSGTADYLTVRIRIEVLQKAAAALALAEKGEAS